MEPPEVVGHALLYQRVPPGFCGRLFVLAGQDGVDGLVRGPREFVAGLVVLQAPGIVVGVDGGESGRLRLLFAPGLVDELRGREDRRVQLASLYETFPAPEARRIAKRLEFHHTPKHGSWLNMAEIEFSVLGRACLKGRNPDEDSLHKNISAYEGERNAASATIN